MARAIAIAPITTAAIRATFISSASVASPFRMTLL